VVLLLVVAANVNRRFHPEATGRDSWLR